ncbi:hypothetical protein CCP2SC5_1530002 [Azospirillaceae bacterium]
MTQAADPRTIETSASELESTRLINLGAEVLSRRAVLRAGAAAGLVAAAEAGALILGFSLQTAEATSFPPLATAGRVPERGPQPVWLGGWICIAPEVITIRVSQTEMGQGVFTALPMALAEELACDWNTVRVEMAPVEPQYYNPIFGMMGTGGSTSVRAFFTPLRKAGAAARRMLIEAAAEAWSVPFEECSTNNAK